MNIFAQQRLRATIGGCAILALSWAGCAAPLGDEAARQAGEDSEPLEHEFRVIELSGFSYEPLIEIVSSADQLSALTDDDEIQVDVDFTHETVIYVSWYRPDPCTTRTLSKVLQVGDSNSAELIYTSERDPDQFCPAVIAPFEQLVITELGCDSAVLVVDESVVASYANP